MLELEKLFSIFRSYIQTGQSYTSQFTANVHPKQGKACSLCSELGGKSVEVGVIDWQINSLRFLNRNRSLSIIPPCLKQVTRLPKCIFAIVYFAKTTILPQP